MYKKIGNVTCFNYFQVKSAVDLYKNVRGFFGAVYFTLFSSGYVCETFNQSHTQIFGHVFINLDETSLDVYRPHFIVSQKLKGK